MYVGYTDIDSEETPLGLLTLRRYDAENGDVGYEIRLGGNFLMASHGAHSEQAMAPLAHERLQRPVESLAVLVGGLGAGHTLRAILALPGVTRVVVAEIGAKVVEWNRLYFREVTGGAVDDPRVEMRIADLADVLRDSPAAFDLLLLDVDNGPGWLAAPGNAGLYDRAGVETCRDALRPGGVLAVWSPQPNPVFLEALRLVFPAVEEFDTTEIGKKLNEPGDTIYLAVRPH
ncbi:MAG: spermidine synthase [Myxococcales bacterium]|nr:spermidine synthase [Myxococcales bacterium]